MSDIPELTDEQFARALRGGVRKRLMLGQFESGEDISALRRFVGLTQAQFALAMGLRIAARHPRIIRENLGRVESAA